MIYIICLQLNEFIYFLSLERWRLEIEMAKKGLHLGIDVGSVSANTILIDEDKNVIEDFINIL
jgi:activator of 2-hydroxyglutaryl-CoA dehydratase